MHVAVLAAALLVLWPLYHWLAPAGNELDPWLYASYGLVFAVIAAYRSWLETLPGRRRLASLLDQAAWTALPVALLLALHYAPQEATMGPLQRIFYVHVATAWVGGLALTVAFVASVAHLVTRGAASDRLAQAAVELGLLFIGLVLVVGPIWARPAWGIWWTWDARLTTTLIVWVTYLGYLGVRTWVDEPERRARLAAVIGVLAFVGVPIDYFSIRWWRTQHPAPVIGGGAGSGLDPQMKRAFLVMLAAMTILFVALLLRRKDSLAAAEVSGAPSREG